MIIHFLDATNWFIGSDFLINREYPIVFDSIEGVCKETRDSGFYNSAEVKAVLNYINELLQKKWNGKEVFLSDIGVVSPYKAQGNMIRNECNKLGYNNITVGTAEVFQGQERRIMIISTVRTGEKLGFVKDYRVRRKNILLMSFVLF